MSPLNDSDGGSFSVREPIVALSKSRGSDNRISLPVSVSAASHAPLRSLVRCTTWKPSHTSQNSEHTSISPTIRRRLSERVIMASLSCSCHRLPDAVAEAMHGGDQLVAELAAQLVDVDGDRVALDRAVAAVYRILQLRTRDDPAAALHQRQQGAVFMDAERHIAPIERDAAARRVEAQRLVLQHRRHAPLAASQHRTQPRVE